MKYSIVFLFLFSLCGAIEEESMWWNHTTIYELPVLWYKDTNNDGIGDLKGVTLKLNYLEDLKIPAVRLSPIFSSPDQITDDYAVDNFLEIHPALGNMKDFDELITEANKKGIKVILDINLNHCHISHPWFQKSIKKIEPYTDYFIWENRVVDENDEPQVNRPPNDWRNQFRQKSWKWNGERKQFYYNYYNSFAPDFNLRNPKVVEEILKIFKFWFDKGISGFNLLNIISYLDDNKYTNNRRLIMHEDFLKFIQELRKPIDTYNKLNPGKERILMTKPGYYEDEEVSKCLNSFDLISISELSILNIYGTIPTGFFTAEGGLKRWFNFKSERSNFEWMLDSADSRRLADPYNKEVVNMLLFTQALLPGAMHMYYGAEIGMSSHYSSARKCVDTKWEYNDGRTLPMQWDNSVNAGFSSSKCVLQRANPDYTTINVEMQKTDKFSILNFVKTLLKVRQDDVLIKGDIKFSSLSDTVLVLSRKYEKNIINAIVNINNNPEVIQLPYRLHSPSYSLKVLTATPNSYYQEGDRINPLSRFVMRPMSAIAWKLEREYDYDYD